MRIPPHKRCFGAVDKPSGVCGAASERNGNMTLLLTILFLLTIVASLAAGVAAGYWIIFGFLNLFDPKRPPASTDEAAVMAPTAGGD